MELASITHLDHGEIVSFEPDVFIAASGYESRSVTIPGMVEELDCEKIVLGFNSYTKEISRPDNDRYFNEKGYAYHALNDYETPDFEQIIGKKTTSELRILFDISVMTRTWYYHFLKYLHRTETYHTITARMIYCPALYSDPLKPGKQVEIETLSILSDEYRSRKEAGKTALVLGLGNELGMGTHIYEQIGPDTTFLLFPDPSVEKQYVETIFINNHKLINEIPIRNLIGYPMDDTAQIYKLLIDIILPLRKNHRVIIVPLGPKIFSLIAMLIQISYPDVELGYPRYSTRHIRDRKPFCKVIGVDLRFESD